MSQYLGDISAYALAVSQGYTGTEEEYAELMASYATVGQTAVTAAQTATTKASEAATSATTATNKASEATTAATTATTKAAEAQADADAAALDASQAMSAASTATTKATEATTAAATATSAKTDAVAANTAAQSAKTAAQTAQTGAETAAASVAGSAAQIQENADDIAQLKSELNLVVPPEASGTTLPNSQQQRLIDPIALVEGHNYTYSIEFSSALEVETYVYVKNHETITQSSFNLSSGATTGSNTFVSAITDNAAYVSINTNGKAVTYNVKIVDNSVYSSKVAEHDDEIADLQGITGVLNNEIELQYNKYITTPDIGSSVNLTPTAATGYACASVACSKGDIFTLSGTPINNSGVRPYIWVNSNGKCAYRENTTNVFKDVAIAAPADGTLVVNFSTVAPYSLFKNLRDLNKQTVKLMDFTSYQVSGISFSPDTYIATASVGASVNLTPQSLSGCASASIVCHENDIFTLSGTPRGNSGTRAYMWVNANGKCVYRHDSTDVMNDTVIMAPCNGTLVINFLTSAAYSAYNGVRHLGDRIVKNIQDIHSNYNSIQDVVRAPIEALPAYVKNDLAYRPLGRLKYPYLCLSCDDGTAALETYTIPMIEAKGVPCTFSLWTNSANGASVILQTQTGIDAVVNAITNYGCEVAQHGYVEWTEMSERELNAFFETERTNFASMGITVSGAACPGHCIDNRVRAIVGGLFGAVRSGYRGHLSKADEYNNIPGDIIIPYGVAKNGERSNVYGLTSVNVLDAQVLDDPLNSLKNLLDTAIANNYVLSVHWHDWNFATTDENYLSNRALLEAFIDYAKTTSVRYCTIGQIPTLE